MKNDSKKGRLLADLQKAIELELSTLPPYLTAFWSLKPDTNVDSSLILRSVFMEEMLHLTLAANILSAVGGTVRLDAGHIPSYPATLDFEGKVRKERAVDIHLAAFSPAQVETFMQIELPDGFPSDKEVAVGSVLDVSGYTIGEFYAGIKAELHQLEHDIGAAALFSGQASHQIPEMYYWRGGGQPIVVRSLEDADRAIDAITAQGEGSRGSKFDGDQRIFGQPREVAHYYRFKQIRAGRCYRETDRIHDAPSGAPLAVSWGDVFPIKTDCRRADFDGDPTLSTLNERFNSDYSLMLSQLAEGFGGNSGVFYTAIMNGMQQLSAIARTMMQTPIRGDKEGRTGAPTFEWIAPPRT